jgi:hypothetical protein
MSDCLILSKNRPAQLDLLLTSIDRNARDAFDKVTILYTYAGSGAPGYALGYQYVRQEHPQLLESAPRPHREYQFEQAFEADIRAWLDDAGPAVTFLTDDSVFFRAAVAPREHELPYAYRTAGEYHWRRALSGSEENYPLTIVGTTYAKDTIMPLLHYEFPNPTALEAGMANQAHRFTPDVIYGGPMSLCMINANKVSEASNMPHMNIDPAELNTRFLAGERLDLDGIDFSQVDNCQTTLPFVWRAA